MGTLSWMASKRHSERVVHDDDDDAMQVPQPTRKYTPEEKQQLIKNLDIEVEHRVRQLEEWLAVALENFRLHQEALISRIPKLVRGVTMGEFADKYNGDIQACLRALQSERVGGAEFEIDKDTRKRKWAAALEEADASSAGHGHDSDRARALKNARTTTATPKKAVAGPSHARTFAATRTPGALRTATARSPAPKPSSSPYKPNKLPPAFPVRAMSPPKPNAAAHQRAGPPSSATFNPSMLPPKAPTYPTLRAPRRDESMLSVNGSPLANPYTLGLGWFAGQDLEEDDEAAAGEEEENVPRPQGKGKHKQAARPPSKPPRRVNSIVVRHDPSVSLASSSSSSSSSAAAITSPSQSRPQPRANGMASRTGTQPHAAPAPPSAASALVSIPTRDGHLLEFDPLVTSPRALDRLVGITDSAKKQAKDEMARLVREAVRKWAIE